MRRGIKEIDAAGTLVVQLALRWLLRDADLEAAGLPAPGEGKRYLAYSELVWLTRP